MITSIPQLNLKALHATSLACRKPGAGRTPALEYVAVLDDSTFIACDSFRLLLTSSNGLTRGDLVEHARTIGSTDVLLVSAVTIAKMVKDVKAAKSLLGYSASLDVRDNRVRIIGVADYQFDTADASTSGLPYVSERRCEADYPNFGQLYPSGEPQPTCASFNPVFLADFSKYSKAACGTSNSPWTFEGGIDARKPTMWSSLTEDVNMVCLLMPVRTDTDAHSWVTPVKAAAA